jgi:hypothetical protein
VLNRVSQIAVTTAISPSAQLARFNAHDSLFGNYHNYLLRIRLHTLLTMGYSLQKRPTANKAALSSNCDFFFFFFFFSFYLLL